MNAKQYGRLLQVLEEIRDSIRSKNESPTIPTDWLTIDEACKYLHLTARTARIHLMAICREGRVRAKKVGNKWLLKKEWLDAWNENPRK